MVSNLEQVARRRETNRVTMETRMAIKLIAVPQARNNAAYRDMIICGRIVLTIHTQAVLEELTSQLFVIANASANEANLEDKNKDDESARKSTRSKHCANRRPEEVHATEVSSGSKPGGPTVTFERIEQFLEDNESYKSAATNGPSF